MGALSASDGREYSVYPVNVVEGRSKRYYVIK